MNGINKAIVVGTLGNDPEPRYMPSGGAVTSFSVATNESWKDKTTGEKKERCEWHNISMFGKLAEIAGEYLKKGSQVYLEGSIRTEKYNDKAGVEKYSTKIIANQMQMLGGNNSTQNDQSQHASGNRNHPNPTYEQAQPGAAVDDSFSDDIPF